MRTGKALAKAKGVTREAPRRAGVATRATGPQG